MPLRPSGLRALAIPCSVRVNQTWVLSLLSSATRPIAKRVESWLPNEARTHLQRAFGHCEVRGRIGADSVVAGACGAIETAWRAGVARVAGIEEIRAMHAGDSAAASFTGLLALPVLGEGVVSEVVALYF